MSDQNYIFQDETSLNIIDYINANNIETSADDKKIDILRQLYSEVPTTYEDISDKVYPILSKSDDSSNEAYLAISFKRIQNIDGTVNIQYDNIIRLV